MNKRIVITAVPIVICNLIAFTGQLAFIREHMAWPFIGDIGLAAGIESIALFLAYMAHDALIREDSAFKLRVGAYLAASVAAALNYSHYAGANASPNFAAISTALMSFMSPILWSIYSRRISRDALKAKGLIESRTVKFSSARWFWWPLRTFPVYRNAVWSGVTDPSAAITQYENQEAEREALTASQPERMQITDAANKTQAIRVALAENPESTGPEIAAWLDTHGWPGIDAAYVRTVRSADARRSADMRRAGIHALTTGQNTGTDS